VFICFTSPFDIREVAHGANAIEMTDWETASVLSGLPHC
jgi:hypothetical protein